MFRACTVYILPCESAVVHSNCTAGYLHHLHSVSNINHQTYKKQRMMNKLRRSCAKLSTADASLSSIPFEQFQPLLSIFYCNLARRLSSSYLHTSLDLATYLLWMLSQSAVDGAGSLAERSFEFTGG